MGELEHETPNENPPQPPPPTQEKKNTPLAPSQADKSMRQANTRRRVAAAKGYERRLEAVGGGGGGGGSTTSGFVMLIASLPACPDSMPCPALIPICHGDCSQHDGRVGGKVGLATTGHPLPQNPTLRLPPQRNHKDKPTGLNNSAPMGDNHHGEREAGGYCRGGAGRHTGGICRAHFVALCLSGIQALPHPKPYLLRSLLATRRLCG